MVLYVKVHIMGKQLFMKTLICIVVFFMSGPASVFSQEETLENDEIEISDTNKYLEDQFYIGLTYNILLNRPAGVSQNNFSYGIQLGYIKDIPLNERRNIGLGIGLGYATNSYFTNLRATQVNEQVQYNVIGEEVSYKRNKVSTHLVEIPIEFRWRTSTTDSYKFWRVYTGIKFSYAFSARSKFVASDKIKFTNKDIDKLQYGLYFSFGYNTWNFYGYYQLNKFFKSGAAVNETGELIKTGSLNFGLMFYIL